MFRMSRERQPPGVWVADRGRAHRAADLLGSRSCASFQTHDAGNRDRFDPPRAVPGLARDFHPAIILMNSPPAVENEAGTDRSTPQGFAAGQLRLFSMIFLSAWCGLTAGLLEVATIVVRKRAFDSDQLYRMSRHFVWMIPVANLSVFLGIGLLGCGMIVASPARVAGSFRGPWERSLYCPR